MFGKRKDTNVYRIKTGDRRLASLSMPIWVDVYKEIPMQEVVDAILEHIGLDISYVHERPDGFRLTPKAQTEAKKRGRPRKPNARQPAN